MTSSYRINLAGQTIGNWRLIRLLGEGAFGAVYESEHHAIAGRRAAVKILDPQNTVEQDKKRRFVNEASAASRIAHENIVQVFDGGVTDSGACYVVMELLTGQDLNQLLAQGPWNVGRTVNLGVQAASALQAAHNVGIVHRDLKPDNMYIVKRDHNLEFLKILDFGIAKLRDAEGETKAGIWLGTPAYMSPEQWQTIPDIDGRADIYALGVVLYECITGRLPYYGNSPFDWLNAHLTHPVPDPAVLAPMPPILSQLIQRMLAKRREERPQSMGEVLSELSRCTVVRSNPWLRLMSEPVGAGQRRSGPIEVLRDVPLVVPVEATPQISTLRQGAAEVQIAAPPRLERARVTSHLLTALASIGLCVCGVFAAQHFGMVKLWPGAETESADLDKEAETATAAAVQQPASTGATKPEAKIEAKTEAKIEAKTEGAALQPAVKPWLKSSDGRISAKQFPEELAVMGPGRFKMGGGGGHHRHGEDAAGGSGHTVEVKRFAIGKYEVTIGEYQAYAAATRLPLPTLWEGAASASGQHDLPMTLVSRDQAAHYCRWRYGALAGRLPSEAEWEFAARDGRTERRYPWPGKHFDASKVNAGKPQLELVPVQSLPDGTTDLGLLHMLGNAAEWTASGGEHEAENGDHAAASGVVRGGAADSPTTGLSAATRRFLPADGRYPSVGFRCAASSP